ncbi:hypothetical protein MTR_3g045140 [Medicago truncatula]|uniref:Uncharacterized protein n=1 Tax=Medicago truncatula TaxID=3880 RepID=A0A072UVT4_MEDTR|nr:hypothetical protein MTR_3g045140 [Medicago truncatula]
MVRSWETVTIYPPSADSKNTCQNQYKGGKKDSRHTRITSPKEKQPLNLHSAENSAHQTETSGDSSRNLPRDNDITRKHADTAIKRTAHALIRPRNYSQHSKITVFSVREAVIMVPIL